MNYLIFDANNIASLSFYRAKSILMEQIYDKPDVTEKEHEYLDEAKNNITGFALHLFFNKIHSLISEHSNRRIIFVWDGRYGSAWRKKENNNYKSNRNHDNDIFYTIFINMMNTARDILNNYPVIQFSKEDSEADDIIYSIIKLFNGENTVVISTDSDMIQLCQHFNNVQIWNPISKKYHIIPDYNYVIYKSVVGDASDNIQGIPRYGKAKGQKIAKEGMSSLNEEQKQIIKNNIKIIDMSENPYEPENTQYAKSILDSNTLLTYDIEQIRKYFFDMKLKQQLDKFGSTMKLIKSFI